MRKKVLNTIKFILANISFILSLVMTVFAILDRFNPLMGFISSDFSNLILFILAISAATLASIIIFEKFTQNVK